MLRHHAKQCCGWYDGDHVYSKKHGRAGVIVSQAPTLRMLWIKFPESERVYFVSVTQLEWLAPGRDVPKVPADLASETLNFWPMSTGDTDLYR